MLFEDDSKYLNETYLRPFGPRVSQRTYRIVPLSCVQRSNASDVPGVKSRFFKEKHGILRKVFPNGENDFLFQIFGALALLWL